MFRAAYAHAEDEVMRCPLCTACPHGQLVASLIVPLCLERRAQYIDADARVLIDACHAPIMIQPRS
jgi:hypothetical protein